MKKIISLFAILMLMAVATTGYAQVKAGSVHITPTIGMYKFEGSEDMDASIALGLRAGYNFTKYFGVEAYGHWVPTEINYIATMAKKSMFTAMALKPSFNLLPDRAFVAFFALGVGGIHYSRYSQDTTDREDNKIAADYGVGREILPGGKLGSARRCPTCYSYRY